MQDQIDLLSTVTMTQTASKAFGDLKYWLTELAVSLLMQSEREAEAARVQLLSALTDLETHEPEAIDGIRQTGGPAGAQGFPGRRGNVQ